MELTKQEKDAFEMSQSILRMSSEAAWKEMTAALLAGEADQLTKLEMYLDSDPHPDREEVMSMCLRWYGVRMTRRILLRNVQEAKDFKKDLGKTLLQEFVKDQSQPVPEDLRDLLLEVI